MSWYGWWRPSYLTVAERRERARQETERLRKKGKHIQPVEISGRKITRNFWGEAWCDHLESFSDYENRLPRGRSYVRSGSVCHLDISNGTVSALVSGTRLYEVEIVIKTLSRLKWKEVQKRCAGQIGSLLELLQGKLSENVMRVVTDRDNGLFPLPEEISLQCSCPDWALMCKHVAAVLYGVGTRLDEKPELLFLLRGVDHEELIDSEIDLASANAGGKENSRRIADDALEEVFGIEIAKEEAPLQRKRSKRSGNNVPKVGKKPSPRKTGAKKTSQHSLEESPVSGQAVAALRKRFGMSQSQFARLLGVSTPSISNWEKKPGTLSLQKRSLSAWNTVEGLTKRQAWRKLQGS